MPTALQNVLPLLAALAGYLIGSLSFAVIISRVMGLSDPRSYGSGNPGATNVLRSGHRGAVWGKVKERARVFIDRGRAEAVARKLAVPLEVILSVVELEEAGPENPNSGFIA